MFKFIEGTDHKAIVTSDGRVFKRKAIYKGNRITGRHLIGWSEFREVKPWSGGCGYLAVTIPYRKDCSIHRLVAEAFIPNPLGLRDVDHIDGDKTNNRIENLRWVSHRENCNNPNTKYKHVYGSKCKVWSYIQGFNPKTNFRTPIFMNLRETSTWITPEGKDIKPGSLVTYLNKKAVYRNYYWTAKLVTGEEYRKLLE